MSHPSLVLPALRKIDPNPRRALATLYRTRTIAEVANILGVTPGPVRDAMVRLDVRRRGQRTPAPKGILEQGLSERGRASNLTARALLRKLYYTKGRTLDEIGFEFGVSHVAVARFMDKCGLPKRRTGPRKSN